MADPQGAVGGDGGAGARAARGAAQRAASPRSGLIETARHLLFGVDTWLRRAVLGEPAPYDPLDLQHDEASRLEGVELLGQEATPSLETVLALRADRMARVREVIAGLTDEQPGRRDRGHRFPGYPEAWRQARRAPLPRRGGQRGVVAPPVRRTRPGGLEAVASAPAAGLQADPDQHHDAGHGSPDTKTLVELSRKTANSTAATPHRPISASAGAAGRLERNHIAAMITSAPMIPSR